MKTATVQLSNRRCKPCTKATPALKAAQISKLLQELPGWAISRGRLTKAYSFEDFYHTIGFVNAVAFIANHEDHHPDLEVSYNKCVVHFSTHSIKGLSENDFICAAKVEMLPRKPK